MQGRNLPALSSWLYYVHGAMGQFTNAPDALTVAWIKYTVISGSEKCKTQIEVIAWQRRNNAEISGKKYHSKKATNPYSIQELYQ